MAPALYRYRFTDAVDLQEAEGTLLLAFVAAEGIHGEARVRLDGAYTLDPTIRAIVVDAGTPVGQDVAGIFTRLLACEFGPDAFHVGRVNPDPGCPCQETM